MEIWEDVIGFEGLYKVSDLGNIKSVSKIIFKHNCSYLSKEKILKGTLNSGNYLLVGLYKDGKKTTTAIHVQVAKTFLNYSERGILVCDHINNNPVDNRKINLRLVSVRENTSKDRKYKTSKYTGVSWDKSRKKWISQIHVNGKTKTIGRFLTETDASNSYQNALKLCKKNN